MKIRKKGRRLACFLMTLLLLPGICGCGAEQERENRQEENAQLEEPQAKSTRAEEVDRLKIVCTVFPEYDWVRQILGERAQGTELTLLMQNGSDMHSYQPTVWDMVKIAEADLFIYVGGESDFWVEDALKSAANPDRRTLNLMEILAERAKEEEHVEGMQTARGSRHGEEIRQDEETGHGEETEYDEHVWLSLWNAKAVCGVITETLTELDGAHRDIYEQNCKKYLGRLDALDEKYVQAAAESPCPVLLFADRFPFRYLLDDYGIEYYAAFPGCSAETEASFETMVFLIDKVSGLSLPAVLTLDGSDGRLARTVAESAGERDVLILDSMQSVGQKEIEAGESYLSIMEKNLETLKKALPKAGR